MKLYIKNKKLLEKNHCYNSSFEHDACGVGVIASLDGKKRRQVVSEKRMSRHRRKDKICGWSLADRSSGSPHLTIRSSADLDMLLCGMICQQMV